MARDQVIEFKLQEWDSRGALRIPGSGSEQRTTQATIMPRSTPTASERYDEDVQVYGRGVRTRKTFRGRRPGHQEHSSGTAAAHRLRAVRHQDKRVRPIRGRHRQPVREDCRRRPPGRRVHVARRLEERREAGPASRGEALVLDTTQ